MKKRSTLTIISVIMVLFIAKGAAIIEYRFDARESDLQTILDQSGNGFNVKFNRNVTLNTNYPFAEEHSPASGTPVNPVYPQLEGKDKSGRTFYNPSTIGTISNSGDINLAETGVFTMEGWIYVEAFATPSGDTPIGATIWYMGSSVGGTSVFSLKYTDEGVLFGQFNALSQAGSTRTFTTDYTLPMKSWTHVAFVKNTNRVEIYVNGELIYIFSEVGISSRGMPTALANAHIANNIKGMLNDFRLSNQALTPEQLGYFKPFTPVPPKGTILILR